MEKTVQVIKATKGENKNKIRVAVYARVSSDKDDNINSFLAQMKYYTEYIEANEDKMTLVDIYADEGITGTELKKRDEMQRLIRDCELKKIDRVLVKSVTRFARNSLECLEIVRKMAKNRVSVLFENDNIDTSKMNNEMMLYIKSAFAQSEATSASKRMSTSVRMKMEDGTYYNVSAPFGYKWNNRQLEIDDEKARYVKMIYKLYLNGERINTIREKVLLESQGKENFSYNTIRYILKNERYVGDTLWQKKYTPNVLPFRRKINRGEVDKYLIRNSHESIISREDFELAQQIRQERKGKYYSDNKRETGFYHDKITCKKCGWHFRYVSDKTQKTLVCSRKYGRGEQCNTVAYTEEILNKAFITFFNKLKQNKKEVIDDLFYQLQSLKKRTLKENSDMSIIDEELAALNQENSIYNQMRESRIIDDVLFYEKTDLIKNKIATLRERRNKILSSDKDAYFTEQLRELKTLLEDNGYLYEFDSGLYEKAVKEIIADEDGSLVYGLYCGLQLRLNKREIFA